jgi:hypothetical protein
MSLTGGRRCGAVRYTIALEGLPPVYCCHCLACQSGSGSAFSQQAVIPAGAIEATGELLDYRFERPDGGEGHHRLCAACFTRLWSTSSMRPAVALVRAGTLDDSQSIEPKAHIWTSRKQSWVVLPADVPQWPENAPPEEFAAALRPGG